MGKGLAIPFNLESDLLHSLPYIMS